MYGFHNLQQYCTPVVNERIQVFIFHWAEMQYTAVFLLVNRLLKASYCAVWSSAPAEAFSSHCFGAISTDLEIEVAFFFNSDLPIYLYQKKFDCFMYEPLEVNIMSWAAVWSHLHLVFYSEALNTMNGFSPAFIIQNVWDLIRFNCTLSKSSPTSLTVTVTSILSSVSSSTSYNCSL